MNEAYQEVREQLRRQHAMNKNEVHGKEIPAIRSNYYKNDSADTQGDYGMTFSFKFKIFVFLCAVMLFSCYLYGGQDIKKGASMAYHELRTAVSILEEEEPLVKEVVGYCREGYHWMRDIAQEYIDE
ncbi:MAG: hypothetical protein K2L07_13715 [Lachnospiraceae bacterium]|nr:hypothetical protein [Lachnospiraceae bacterium]